MIPFRNEDAPAGDAVRARKTDATKPSKVERRNV
jgi:hypothetical protein